MIKRLLDQGKEYGEIRNEVDTTAVTEMLFAGLLGTSVIYSTKKSYVSLDQSINSLIKFLESLSPK